MNRYTLLAATLLVAAPAVLAQEAVDTPLAEKRFTYPDQIPYQVDTQNGVRGIQTGYNKCNSTTEGQSSMCQTAFLNSIDDFCLWAPPVKDSLIADTEGEEVAWCTKPGRGTRTIPPGALKGVQFTRTSEYVQVVGFLDQTKINIKEGDTGGELDPHGADLRGNPLGGLFYSNAFPSNGGKNDSFQQVIEWHNFMGGGAFCLKACDPAGKDAAKYCQHIYDRIGCAYNAPSSVYNTREETFTSCEGEPQDFPGVYKGADGVTTTYTQPAESLGAIQTMPYDPRIPASSNCVTHTSAALYAAATSAFPNASGSGSASATGTAKPTGSSSGKGSATGSASSSQQTGANGAGLASVVSLVAVIGAAVGAIAVLA